MGNRHINLSEEQKLLWIHVLPELISLNIREIQSVSEIQKAIRAGNLKSQEINQKIIKTCRYNYKLYDGFINSTKWNTVTIYGKSNIKLMMLEIRDQHQALLEQMQAPDSDKRNNEALRICQKILSLTEYVNSLLEEWEEYRAMHTEAVKAVKRNVPSFV